MDLANNIKAVLSKDAHFKTSQNRHSTPEYQLIVAEDDRDASLKELKIIHLKKHDFCFNLDLNHKRKFKTYSAYINSNTQSGYDQRCDFVIIRYEQQKWHVYFGDLKSTTVKPQNILKKLRASQLFFDYLITLSEFEQYWQNPTIKPTQYQAHYLVIHDANSGLNHKNPARAGNTPSKIYQAGKLKLFIFPLNVMNDGKAKISFNKIINPK